MLYSTLFFDLDDTLYPSTNGLWEAIKERMALYMAERLDISWEEIPAKRMMYLKEYGTTMRGLQHEYGIDAEEYLEYVHALPLEQYLAPEPEIRKLLHGLPQRKWIFTNADKDHALRVIRHMELGNCFHGIIDVRAIQFSCKPEPIAYQMALKIAGEEDAGKVVLLDDSQVNLAVAKTMGFKTVLVGRICSDQSEIDHWIQDIQLLPIVMPELWN